MALTVTEMQAIVKGIVPGIKEYVENTVGQVAKRVVEQELRHAAEVQRLEQRIAELEDHITAPEPRHHDHA